MRTNRLKAMMARVLPDKKRCCMVSGSITIVVPILDASASGNRTFFDQYDSLFRALKNADYENPWRDPEPTALDFVSSGAMSEYQKLVPHEDGMVFYFRPLNRYLSNGQVHAYQKYLDTLAYELAQSLGIEVRSSVEVQTRFAPSGNKILPNR